ncbi:MAG TPA: hypothetical protein VHK88_00285 [Aquihabitans sp.]|jgi:hypothetical protein|nr:hypothetical protein [Aquihabitans sp.]
MAEIDPQRIQALVEEAIDHGAASVEEIHRAIASAPLQALQGIEALSGPAAAAQDLTERSIGAVYDTIRRVNEQVGVYAEQLLRQRDDLTGR